MKLIIIIETKSVETQIWNVFQYIWEWECESVQVYWWGSGDCDEHSESDDWGQWCVHIYIMTFIFIFILLYINNYIIHIILIYWYNINNIYNIFLSIIIIIIIIIIWRKYIYYLLLLLN